ncbi:MAG: hypothetical protein EA378_01465 [Phycisphaerales bacterium]|nr:MAG: hypothetical protein EA378_01465 [Phycisphaerales bacterium]
MPASDAAFNQVRHILGKLDRSIDQARSRRLNADGGDQVVEPSRPEPGERHTPGAHAQRPEHRSPASDPERGPGGGPGGSGGEPKPAPDTPLSENAKIYGRAKPIRPSGLGFDGTNASKAG